jgi:hypothetical protein
MAILAVSVSACASSEPPKYSSGDSFLMPYSDDASTAPGDAFAGSAMFPRKQMPKHGRSPASDWDFYFKHCSMNGNETFYSKTSYDCSGPFY